MRCAVKYVQISLMLPERKYITRDVDSFYKGRPAIFVVVYIFFPSTGEYTFIFCLEINEPILVL